MKPILIHLSHLVNSSISINGDIVINYSKNEEIILDLLLQSLEINRKLISGICSEWKDDEEAYNEIQNLIRQQRNLELKVSQNLNPKENDSYQ